MKLKNTSHTQLQAALRCPWLYYVSRYHRDKMIIKSEAQVVGIALHTVFERFYLECTAKDDRLKAGQIEWLDKAMKQEFVNCFGQDTLEAVDQYFEEYQESLDDTQSYARSIGRQPYKSPTMAYYWINNYGDKFQQLEADLFSPLAAKFPDIKFKNTLLEIYRHIKKCCENFLALHRKLPKVKEAYVEYRLDPRVPLHNLDKGGRLDLVHVYEDGSMAVYDFKSGRKRWTKTDVRNSQQLLFYAYACKNTFGVLPTRMGIIDTYNNEIVTVDVREEDVVHFEKYSEGSIAYETALDNSIQEVGIEETMKAFPLPIGTLEIGCPCNLIYEEDEAIRCPAYRIEEEN